MSTRFSIPLAEPCFDGNEAAYVVDAMARGDVAQGEYIPRFERMVAEYVGTRYAVAVSSGTAALHLALLAAGVGPDDEVIVPALTFIAPANAIRYCGATPVLVDVEPEYGTMNASLARAYQEASRQRYRTEFIKLVKALLPVHILGHPADMQAIFELAHRHELMIVGDATEALGAYWQERPVPLLVDFGCLSFNGNKLITTGGGGMVLTDDRLDAEQVRYLANQAKDDPTEYVHNEIGYNYRMSNVQAAIGCGQMERIDAKLAAKRRIAETYSRELAGVPGIVLPTEAPWARSAWWLFTILSPDRRGLMRYLSERSIESRPLWTPLHRQPAMSDLPPAHCPVADRIWSQALSLPSSVGLTTEQQERVIAAVKEFHST